MAQKQIMRVQSKYGGIDRRHLNYIRDSLAWFVNLFKTTQRAKIKQIQYELNPVKPRQFTLNFDCIDLCDLSSNSKSISSDSSTPDGREQKRKVFKLNTDLFHSSFNLKPRQSFLYSPSRCFVINVMKPHEVILSFLKFMQNNK